MSAQLEAMKETHVRCKPCAHADWGGLVAAAKQQFGWNDHIEVFAYAETATECSLTKPTLSQARPGDVPLEGRLFNDKGELRWVVREDGLFDGWLVDEQDGELVRTRTQNYYLIGRGVHQGSNQFAEGRYPGKTFTYPVTVNSDNPAGVRAFIAVKEYFRVVKEHEWAGFVDDKAEQLLNEPMLMEHRFVGVGVSR